MKKVYVVTIEDVSGMCDYPHAPRVFSSKDVALQHIKDTYEDVKDEFDENEYTFDYIDGESSACIYVDGRWSEDHWMIRMEECTVDEYV